MAYVTKEARLFEKNGLDVELIQVRGALSAAALVAREVYIAQMAGPAVVQATLAGSDVVMVAGLVNRPGSSGEARLGQRRFLRERFNLGSIPRSLLLPPLFPGQIWL